MPTINDLADCVADCGGMPRPHIQAVQRYLREAGILPASTKRKVPQVEAVHATAMLLACVGHEHQTHAVAALRALWITKHTDNRPHWQDKDGNVVEGSGARVTDGPKFGPRLEDLISKIATAPNVGSGVIEWVRVWRSQPHAIVRCIDKSEIYRAQLKVEGHEAMRTLVLNTENIGFFAEVHRPALLRIGLLVQQSRREAIERDLSIETESTWLALEPDRSTATTSQPEPQGVS
jgi:hypothetical protein